MPLLKAFAGTSAMRFVGKLKQHGDHPAVSHTPSCVPDLVSVAGDVLIALHLIYEASLTPTCVFHYVQVSMQ